MPSEALAAALNTGSFPLPSASASAMNFCPNAALISKALANAKESLEMLDNLFIGPKPTSEWAAPICIVREYGVRALFKIDDRGEY